MAPPSPAGCLGRLYRGARSLVFGMAVTIRALFQTLFQRKAVTLKYPHEKPALSGAYRSAIKLIRFEETQSHDCVACLACQRICPSFCISIEGGKVEGLKKKRASDFIMDFSLCSLCGLCIDVCPTDTLEYSRLYDEAGYTRDWKMDLIQPFRADEDAFREAQAERERLEAEEKAAEKERKLAAAKAAKAAKAAEAAEPDAGAAAGEGTSP